MAKAKILGKLEGIIASAKEKSRNGRSYSEGFWDAKFNDELFKEGLENKVFAGELYHPDDEEEYSQIHLDDRSAVVLTDVKKKNSDYIGVFEILPTKAGQCLRNLLDVGVKFGISSRGLSDYNTDVFDESMASNFDLITFDLVAFPGLKSCRLHEIGAVAESFIGTINRRKRIMESLKVEAKTDTECGRYISNILSKIKEDFDDTLQVEDYMALYNIPDDYIDFAKAVEFEDGIPYYNDGEHGRKPVSTYVSKELKSTDDKDTYLVDRIDYNEDLDRYFAVGDWVYLGNDVL